MNMGGESKAVWAEFLGDLDARGLKPPEFNIGVRRPGLEAAGRALGRETADPALQPQASQPSRPRLETHAGRVGRGIPRHDLCRKRG